jgi:hypothetical protein
MPENGQWNWEPGERVIHAVKECDAEVSWLEELHASPDGEQVAAVAKLEEGYGVCVNGKLWEQTFDRAWHPRYSPDGRLTALVSVDGEWTLAVDGEVWPGTYTYLWNTLFSAKGDTIAACAQVDGEYGMVVNGEVWEQLFDTANEFNLSSDGKRSAAVVLMVSMGQAEIFTYQKGCYSVAVNGEAWDNRFVNAWTPVFDPENKRVAVQTRSTLYDYTIVVDGKPWGKNFPAIWEPRFNPSTGAVVAPVRQAGKWGMAQDGQIIWDPNFYQLWHQLFSPDGKKLYAIGATKYGRWTVVDNGSPWPITVGDMVEDLTVSADGLRAAAAVKEGARWSLMADRSLWNDWYEMIWSPVFSPDSKHLAAKVELPGKRYTVVVNGKPFKQTFDQCWEPVFSPDSRHLLIRAVQDGKFKRIVAGVHDF